MPSIPAFPVGTVFKTRHRSPNICIVTDFLTTHNLAGEVVKVRYVATHTFLGQLVMDSDVTETTIRMGLVSVP